MKTPRILTTTIALLLTARALAVTDTWDGGGADNNLSTNLNWLDNTAPVSDLVNTDLIFAGAVRLTPNVSAVFSTNSVTFNNTAGAFAIGGTTLNIGVGGIVNNDTQTQTFDNAITLGTATSSFNAASGGLTFNNNVNIGTSTLALDGAGAFSLGVIFGGGAVNKNGAGTMTWAPNTTQTLDLAINSGTVNTVADASGDVFSAAASIAVNGAGTFNINENLTLDGALLTRATGAALTLAAGKTLTVQNGGDVIVTGAFTNPTASTITVTGAGSTFSANSTTFFHGGSTMNVLAGGGLSIAGATTVVGSTGNGTLLVSGAGSTFGASTLIVAQSGATGTATFSSTATGALTGNLVVGASTVGTNGTLNILSGAVVSAPTLAVGTSPAALTGTLTINGAGSALTISGSAPTSIGAASASTATVNVQSGGTYTTGAADVFLNATGTLAIAGGTVNAGGNLFVSGQLTRDATGVFNLAAGRTLTLQGGGDFLNTATYSHTTASTVTVSGAGSTLTASGGSSPLSFSGGSTLNVLAGAQVISSGTMAFSAGADVGNATVLVGGAGSQLTAAAGSIIFAANGNTATGTFSNGASGSVPGFLILASGPVAGTHGTLSIQSGATFSASNLSMGNGIDATSTAALTVDGAGSAFTATSGFISSVIGAASGGPATMTVQNSGTVNSNAPMNVNATGTLAISGGTYNANGNLLVNGGQLTRNGAGTLTLAQDTTLTVQNGGDAIITGLFQQLNRANLTVTGAGSTFTTGGDFQWEGGNNTLALISVNSGGLLSSGGALHLARTNSAVAMTVSGAGSQVVASPFFTSEWQAGVLLVNGASASLGGLRIADANFAGGSFASLGVQSGSTATLTNLAIATVSATANGSLTVEGTGSAVTQTGASFLTLGAAFASTATLSVNNGGAFTSGTGAFTFNPTGVLNVGGGTATFNGPLTNNGGTVNFTSGALLFTNPGVNLTVGNGGLLGANLTLTSDKRLLIGGTTTIEPFRTLALNGGTFTTSALVNNGALAFTSGTLAITGAGGFNIGSGALGANVVLGAGANLQVTNTATVAAGASLTVNGGTFTAGTLTNSGTVRANVGTAAAASGTNNSGGRIFIADTLDISGTFVNAGGGRITLEGGTGLLSGAGTLSNSGVVTGDGTITKTLSNLASGEVRGEFGRALNFTNGAFNSGQITLLGGTVEFGGVLTHNAGAFISGHGALFTGGLTNGGQIAFSGGNTDVRGDVANMPGGRIVTSGAGAVTTFFDDVVHNGTEIRTSAGCSTVFLGAVSGAGPYTGTGTVYFEGDLRPGNSPASVLYEGDLVLGGSATLTLELGGLLLGGEYDHLNVGGTFTTDGALDVVLYGGFAPHFGDAFDLFDAGALAGNFDAITLPALSGDLAWDDSQLSTNGTLRVVPEPGVGVLLASALSLLGLRRRRTLECGGKRQRDTAFGKSPGGHRAAPHPQSIPKAAWR